MSQQNSKIQPSNGWAVATGLRLPIPPNKERGVFFRSISGISRFFGRPELPNIFPVINTNRRLFWAWLFFASRLMPFGRLPARTRELVILRVAFNCRSRYEFAQHLEIAQRLGVNDQDILATTKPAEQCAEQHLQRSEEHTSELQSRPHLVCRLLLEKKKKNKKIKKHKNK